MRCLEQDTIYSAANIESHQENNCSTEDSIVLLHERNKLLDCVVYNDHHRHYIIFSKLLVLFVLKCIRAFRAVFHVFKFQMVPNSLHVGRLALVPFASLV